VRDVFTIAIKIWKKGDLSQALITTKLNENFTLGLRLYRKDNENVQYPSPAKAVLNFQHSKVMVSIKSAILNSVFFFISLKGAPISRICKEI
jgi:hypothetical protein